MSNEIDRISFCFRYEHHCALNGGADGLDVVRKILNESRTLLKSKGYVESSLLCFSINDFVTVSVKNLA